VVDVLLRLEAGVPMLGLIDRARGY